MADVLTNIKWNKQKLGHAIGTAPDTKRGIEEKTRQICASANAIGGGFRTGRYYDRKAGELKGNTAAVYESSVQTGRHATYGIVYTANYAAMVDNQKHNTLLKAKG